MCDICEALHQVRQMPERVVTKAAGEAIVTWEEVQKPGYSQTYGDIRSWFVNGQCVDTNDRNIEAWLFQK